MSLGTLTYLPPNYLCRLKDLMQDYQRVRYYIYGFFRSNLRPNGVISEILS